MSTQPIPHWKRRNGSGGTFFDRFDICEAHSVLEADYNVGGWLQERPSNRRRMESTGCQLHRMRFSHGMGGGSFRDLSENGKEIYMELVERYGLPDPEFTEEDFE